MEHHYYYEQVSQPSQEQSTRRIGYWDQVKSYDFLKEIQKKNSEGKEKIDFSSLIIANAFKSNTDEEKKRRTMSGETRFCPRCGSQVPADAAFCPRCGAQLSATTQAPTPSQPPTPYYSRREYRRHEKQEKNEKAEKGEKGRGPGGSLIGPIVGGLILIWLGVTFYLQESGVISSSNWWAYFLVGIGVILIIQGLLFYARSRRTSFGPFIGGVILILIGLTYISNYSFGNLWPLILVAIGVAVIASAYAGRRRSPAPVSSV